MIEIVPAEVSHISALVTRARKHEVFEGFDMGELLRLGLSQGRGCATALFDGTPGCVYGIFSSTLLGENHMWMLTTDLVDQSPMAFLRKTKRLINSYREAYGLIYGFVQRDFEKSQRWMEWLGFRPIGHFGNTIKYELSNGR